MKILFVCSGNSPNGISPIVKSQGESLRKNGLNLDYFAIQGRGLIGYLKNILPLRIHVKNNNYDIIHSHYSLSGWISTLTFTKVPKIVSYMGSDTYGGYDKNGRLRPSSIINRISAKLLQFFVKRIIVKATNLKKHMNVKKKTKWLTFDDPKWLNLKRPLTEVV